MHDYLIEMLECPVCHGELTWTIGERCEDHVEEAEARCVKCATSYPVREGIALFLTPDLPRNDLWEQTSGHLTQYLGEHPEIGRQLMDVPLGTLAPADQFFRALVLEERGNYAEAQAAAGLAYPRLYTPQYLACHESQINCIVEQLRASDGPVIDLASGRCSLVEVLARRLGRPVVATDFSPRVLRRDRRWLEFLDLYDRVSLLSFDARRTPFRDGAIKTLTTNLGLPNIAEPGDLLQELRRVVSGTFWAISHFYPEDDEVNATAIHEAGLAPLLFRRSALELFAAAGWQVEIVNSQQGRALPTPRSKLLGGAGVDGFPVAETILEWCVLVAR